MERDDLWKDGGLYRAIFDTSLTEHIDRKVAGGEMIYHHGCIRLHEDELKGKNILEVFLTKLLEEHENELEKMRAENDRV